MAKSRKLSDFRQQAMNANKHTERGMKALEASMNEVGYTAPMIAAADGEIIAGSARHETAANVFGADVEPVIVESDGKRPIVVVRTDIKNAETRAAKRIGLLDNRVQQIDLDFDAEVLAQLYAEDATLTAGLWNDGELTKLLNEADRAGNDIDQMWENMPEFVQEDVSAFKTISIHFEDTKAVKRFSEVIGQTITDKTKSVWYPKRDLPPAREFAFNEQ